MEFLPGDKVVGSTGCGSFLGTYTTNQNALTITDVAARLEACQDGMRIQAERTLDTLGQITDFQVGPAGLALRDGQLTRLALVPPLTTARANVSSRATDVGGRLWTPIEVLDASGGQLRAGQELSTTVVQFLGGRVEGLSICGPFQANALRSGLAVTVTNIQYNESACRNPKDPTKVQVEDVEADFITALETTASYALRGSELELKDVDGATRIRLVPQPPLEGPTWVVDWIGKAGNKVKGDAPMITFADLGETHTYQGQTGAGANEIFGLYDIKGAAGFEIASNMQVARRVCNNKKQRQNLDACKQEAQFLQALRGAKAFVVREEDMRLLGGKTGTRPIMLLRRQVAGTEAG
jgi:heat shock protein HslJ